ncbi:LOW QUALITY PROTEIN: rab escort protein 1 [Coffea arabica]|uniref:LOW QUALITY PROTEIN: rab escort protein 1 n=1 Tax=Coffea arabica TaxID=13443 RepID=A0ABM4V978_COFAR
MSLGKMAAGSSNSERKSEMLRQAAIKFSEKLVNSCRTSPNLYTLSLQNPTSSLTSQVNGLLPLPGNFQQISQKFPSSIQPTNFDLIVIGSGLEESILACVASLAGKTVLIVDHYPFFGGHFASLPLQDFTDFLHTHSKSCPQPELKPGSSSGEFNVLPLTTRPMYSSVEISVYSPEIIDNYGLFSVDLAGPRVLFCADPMMELILKTDRILNVDIDEFIRFNCGMDASFICRTDEDGGKNLWNVVPYSRSAIFIDNSLTFAEKNQLMRFYKLVQGHFGHGNDEEDRKIPEEDLESPFSELKSVKGCLWLVYLQTRLLGIIRVLSWFVVKNYSATSSSLLLRLIFPQD